MSLRLPAVRTTASGVPRPTGDQVVLGPRAQAVDWARASSWEPPKSTHVRRVDRGPRAVDPIGLVELGEQEPRRPPPAVSRRLLLIGATVAIQRLLLDYSWRLDFYLWAL